MPKYRRRWMYALAIPTAGLLLAGAHTPPPLAYLNHRTLRETGVFKRARGLSVSLPIAASALPTVFVGHSFALTGAGAAMDFPPSTRSCGGFSLIKTVLATGTTDQIPGLPSPQGDFIGGLFAEIPAVTTRASVVSSSTKVWMWFLTQNPGPGLIFSGGPLCSLSAPPSPETITPNSVSTWERKMRAQGWKLMTQTRARWSTISHGKVIPEAGALASVALPLRTPLVVAQVSFSARNPYFQTTDLIINGSVQPPILSLNGVYPFAQSDGG